MQRYMQRISARRRARRRLKAPGPVNPVKRPNLGCVERKMSPVNESLFEFPCDFPIKVMGKSHPDFTDTIVTVIRQFDNEFDASRIETRPSSGGNYTGLTVTV